MLGSLISEVFLNICVKLPEHSLPPKPAALQFGMDTPSPLGEGHVSCGDSQPSHHRGISGSKPHGAVGPLCSLGSDLPVGIAVFPGAQHTFPVFQPSGHSFLWGSMPLLVPLLRNVLLLIFWAWLSLIASKHLFLRLPLSHSPEPIEWELF